MIDYKYYPGKKRHIATFSYDDAPPEDYKLVELFNKYGIKATFNLIGNNLASADYGVMEADAKELYKGHECAVHTETHPWLEKCAPTTLINEILENRKRIEKIVGYAVRGMAYPYGTYDEDVIKTAQALGIVYSRTAGETGGYNLPENWFKWVGTCHHKNSPKYVDSFIETLDNIWVSRCLYIWGHSFEFTQPNTDKGFDFFEEQLKKLAEHKDKIWFATNIEIYDYVHAQKALQVAADESFVYNPTQIDVVIAKDNEICTVPAGKTIYF